MNGKVALITGAAGGIGASCTEHLLKNGAKVAIWDVNRIGVDQKVNELSEIYGKENILGVICDVTNDVEFEDSFKKTIKHFGKLNIVINNAGIVNEKDKNWKKVVDLNFAKFLYDLSGLRVVSINPGLTSGSLDQMAANFVIYTEEFKYQSAEHMGRELIEVLKKAESGDIWTIENNAPAYKTILS